MNSTAPAPETTLDTGKLHALAAAYGVGTCFSGWDRQQREVAPDTLVKILAALGVAAGSGDELDAALADAELAPWRRMLPPAVVVRAGTYGTGIRCGCGSKPRTAATTSRCSGISGWIRARSTAC
jgi:4-alpha-glucanotransferase